MNFLSLNTVSALSFALGINGTALTPREIAVGSDDLSARSQSSLPDSGRESGLRPDDGGPEVEIAEYRALVERHPGLAGEFDWSSAAAGTDGVLRVPAVDDLAASLAIYPDEHLDWMGADALAAFDVQRNEIAVVRLFPESRTLAAGDLSPVNQLSKILAPEMYSSLPHADRAGTEWLSQVLWAQAVAKEGAGVFGATRAQLSYLDEAGVLGDIQPERLDEIVMTRLLVARTAYQYGQALEEFSLQDPDSARGWVPGGMKLARVSDLILAKAHELGLERDVSGLKDTLRSLNSPDYSRVATNPRQYQDGRTDVILSEFAIGFLQNRIIRRLKDRFDPRQQSENEEALLVFRRTFQSGGVCDLIPSLDFQGEPGPALVEMVSFLAGYIPSQEFVDEWSFISSALPK